MLEKDSYIGILYFRFANHPNRAALVSKCPPLPIMDRIVGGKDAPIGQYPWLTLLGYNISNTNSVSPWQCGGSLIGNQYVLTAAHCIKDNL